VRSIDHLDEGPPGAAGRTSGQTVLFLHGLGGGAESWRAQLDGLAPMVRCLSWNMPGYGRSRGLPQVTIAALADAAVSLLDHLEVERAVVVGHSMGGFVAQELALGHPGRVERLVLVATTAVFGQGPGSHWNTGFLEARVAPLNEGRRMTDVARQVVPTLVGPDCRPEVVAAATRLMAAIPAAAYRAALEALISFDARDRLAGLDTPTLCLAGEHDTATPPVDVATLADLIPGARLELVDGAGHLVPQEQPEAVNRLLRSFLARL
jgi:pimeloyl-ACP methyl ester carboxylesterase